MKLNALLFRILGVLMLMSPVSSAQNANEILDASRAAIAEVGGFEAQFKMTGSGPSMFADTLPSMSGKLFFGTHSELGRVIHAIGESKDKQTEPSKPLDVLIAADRFVWVDRAKQEIHEVPNRPGARGIPSSVSLVFIDTFVQSDPYAQDANDAQDITHAGLEEINGVLCDLISIKRGKPTSATRNSAQNYTGVTWWIGAEDKLPRKVARITGEGSFAITLNFEMSNLKLAEPSDKQLDVNRPESFKLISKLPVETPDDESVLPETNTQPESADENPRPDPIGRVDPQPQPTTPSLPSAPAFAFTTSDGATVNNSTQNGRVTLLYFWGSWCAPCTETSPLVDELGSTINNSVFDLFALGIREGNPRDALESFTRSYRSPRVSINPEGLASSFKVRVYPTLVVINQGGSIVYQRSIERDLSPEQLVQAAREAISSALSDA